jgi:hypothetical protein
MTSVARARTAEPMEQDEDNIPPESDADTESLADRDEA